MGGHQWGVQYHPQGGGRGETSAAIVGDLTAHMRGGLQGQAHVWAAEGGMGGHAVKRWKFSDLSPAQVSGWQPTNNQGVGASGAQSMDGGMSEAGRGLLGALRGSLDVHQQPVLGNLSNRQHGSGLIAMPV